MKKKTNKHKLSIMFVCEAAIFRVVELESSRRCSRIATAITQRQLPMLVRSFFVVFIRRSHDAHEQIISTRCGISMCVRRRASAPRSVDVAGSNAGHGAHSFLSHVARRSTLKIIATYRVLSRRHICLRIAAVYVLKWRHAAPVIRMMR